MNVLLALAVGALAAGVVGIFDTTPPWWWIAPVVAVVLLVNPRRPRN